MTRPIRSWGALVAAGAVLLALLALPDRPQELWAVLLSPPLEFPLVLLALVLVRPDSVGASALRLVITVWLLTVLVLKIGDIGMNTAFNRPFNPLLDLPLLGSGWDLASGAVGLGLAGLGLAALAGLALLVSALVWWATGRWARVAPPAPFRRLVALGAFVAGTVVLVDASEAARRAVSVDPPGQTATARLLPARVALLRQSLAELASFNDAAATDPFAQVPGLMDRLAGREVLITFVESYGRTSFETPLYRSTHLPTLQQAGPALREAGFALRSGWLTSPITGGQSWLAHGTLGSGLRLDNQTRYGAMLASPRRTLFEIAGEAGLRPAAVMPAITLAWPEGRMLGFERIHAAADLGYAGRPYNWVTMPDQFTLTALDRIRAAAPQPQFTTTVLISSHAPWVPVPEMVDWDMVGDGRILNRWAEAGDPPQVVWRDQNRVRDQYRQSIDYSLQAVLGHAARQTGPLPLIFVLGDHQPAPFVSLSDSRDVPIHVIGPPDLVALIDAWGWTPGLVPDRALPAWPMEAFRDRFLAAFTTARPAT